MIMVMMIMFLDGIIKVGLVVVMLKVIGVAGVPLALAVSCIISLMILGFRLKGHFSLHIGMESLFRLSLSAMTIFVIGVLANQFILVTATWGMFSLYLTVFVLTISMPYMSINRRMLNWNAKGII